MAALKQVSRDEFLASIYANNLDVHPTIVTAFPYTSEWRFHRQIGKPLWGKTIDRVERGNIRTEYFVAE
jgi:hypothetical protein